MDRPGNIAKYKLWFVTAIFVVTGFVVYANSFVVPIFWDGDDFLTNNLYIKNWNYFPRFFSENVIASAGLVSNYWRPALLAVFSTGWHLWGDWPAGYHFINISLHIANAILLFLILMGLFKNHWLAFFTASAFLVHPLQTEAITYTVGTADPLWVLFIFLLIFYYSKFFVFEQKSLNVKFYWLSLTLFIFALMSKETAIIMPALIVIFSWFLDIDKDYSLKERAVKIWHNLWPFLVIAGFYLFLRATVLNFKNSFNFYDGAPSVFASNFYIRILTFFKILTTYFELIFWPHDLHMERTIDIAASFFAPDVILGAIVFAALLILAFTQRRRWPILSFGVLWFLIGLAPVSNILVPINGLLYEHWLYFSLGGIFLALFWAIFAIGRKLNLQKIFSAIIIFYLIFLGYLTVKRNRDWQNPIAFYNQILQYTPNSYRVINNLGMEYAEISDYNNAEITYKKAIDLAPDIAVAYNNLANVYKNTGKENLAEQYFKNAINVDQGFLYAYNNLADIYLKRKEYQKAQELFESYLTKNGDRIDTLFLLVQIAVAEKDSKGALDYLERALKIDPQNQSIQSAIQQLLFLR